MSGLAEMSDAQAAELKTAIEAIQTSDYNGTAIKFELEAQLDRPEGYGGEREDCEHCEGDGYTYCQNCEDGENYNDDTEEYDTCEDCDGSGRDICDYCEGEGYSEVEVPNWDEDNCDNYIKDYVSSEARNALVYGNFYNDGSVDSEFTFTLMLKDAHYAVEYIEAFKALADEIGKGLDTKGAGMHIAVLNSDSGYYDGDGDGSDGNEINTRCANNFRKSLLPLMPALFFLGSSGHESRGLGYRAPTVSMSEKYCAITGHANVLEYRVFETCYSNPLTVIDNIIVIANTLKYYKPSFIDTSMKLGPIGFKDESTREGLERFYYTEKHVDALERGVALLKPAYKSYEQLKTERNFKVDKQKLKEAAKKRHDAWKAEFTGVKARRRFERLRLYHEAVAKGYNYISQGVLEADKLREFVRNEVEKSTSRNGNLRGNVKDYLARRDSEFMESNVSYTITA